MWNQYIELEILSANSNFIDTSVKVEGKQFFVTFVYGEPDKTKKKSNMRSTDSYRTVQSRSLALNFGF